MSPRSFSHFLHQPTQPTLPPSLSPSLPVRLPPLPCKSRHRSNGRDRLLCHAPCLGIQLLAQCRELPHRAEEKSSRDTQKRDNGTHDKG